MLIESSTCDIYTTQPAGQASSFSNKTLLAPSPTSTQNTLNDPFFCSCVCCHEYKWRSAVHIVEPGSARLTDRVDLEYVMEKNPLFFVKLGSYWICQTCSNSPGVPKLCAKSNLCPWEDVPSQLLTLNLVSRHF